MAKHEWPANDYAIGSYIQATIAENYLSKLKIQPSDKVLDIGCGNGAFTRKILDKVPEGSVLGIDASENMVDLAKDVSRDYPNFSVKKGDVLSMKFISQFDYIVSFWCLQWVNDINKAFANIMKALNDGGRLLTLFPVGDDPFIMGYYAIKDSGQFKSLSNFKPPVDYSVFDNLAKKLKSIPAKQLNVALCPQSIILPSLDVFRKFVNGIAFYQGQLPETEIKEINEAMVQYYEDECQRKYQGEYQFNLTIYLVTGEK
ncbi:MAG: class I SAM-dependent methyltransferase [Legionella longbeachae]|nr:class I SAM-dependent methyltransferase [Legionella longbeachae]